MMGNAGRCALIGLAILGLQARARVRAENVVSNLAVAVTSNSATITWNTDVPAQHFMPYGRTTDMSEGWLEDPSYKVNHIQVIKALLPATTYYYMFHSIDQTGDHNNQPTRSFLTLAAGRSAAKEGDVNGDDAVDVTDLSILTRPGVWNSADAAADINHDGAVDVIDLSTLLRNWGR